ncbi:MAG: hypothetical protein K2R93_12195 [Gemmatimonadaceae bacterium]|nr:hypothetical protein [Gemmatimonadaceae bacterium]
MGLTATPAPPTFTVRRDSYKARVLFAMSADADAPTPLTALHAAVPDISRAHLGVLLAQLLGLGAIQRTGRAQYVRLVGETREFRG